MRRLLMCLALLAFAGSAAPAGAAESRYSIANGCFSLESGGKQVAGPFFMEPTTLGEYLFYGKDRSFLAASGEATETAAEPNDSSIWRVDPVAGGFKIVQPMAGRQLTADRKLAADGAVFSFKKAAGCTTYPEIELSATGKPLTGKTSWAEVRGFVEGHIHGMAFEIFGGNVHCGRPWSKFGVAYALVDCPDHQPNGEGAVLENTLSHGNPVGTHDPVGWPTFKDWPARDSYTHETTYYRWIERAWLGGMRVWTNLLVENRALCEAAPIKSKSCDEMDSVRRQLKDIYDLQDYIDAQNGGPGKGFFRIVKDPFQARRVISQGKMAVVLGIEVSELFGCSHRNNVPQCDKADIDRQLKEFHGRGVRNMLLVNKFDNALAGVAGDAGTAGLVTNSGNFTTTGTFWDLETCQTSQPDKEQIAQFPRDAIIVGGLQAFLPGGATPGPYPPGPHCNTRGLTDLGEYLVRQMIDRGMMVDPDHLSQRARDAVLNLLEAKRHSGSVSSHSWSNEADYPRIDNVGGFIMPSENSSKRFIAETMNVKKSHNARYRFGIGFGSDLNGLSAGSGPPDKGKEIKYPFKSFDGGVTLDKQKSGQRTFDFNTEGVAHYGLYPDWVEGIRKLGGNGVVNDLAAGAESYIQMWERSVGIEAPTCRTPRVRFTNGGLARIRLSNTHARLLRSAGQPQVRKDRVWRWCVQGYSLKKARVSAVLTPKGRVALVTSTALRHSARGVSTGEPLKGSGIVIRPAGKTSRFVYGVRKGRVTFVGVASRDAMRKLGSYLRIAGVR